MDDARLELVRDWLTRASHDLAAARALSALDQPLLDTAIYHCQQAAEKTVKAWLQFRDDPFPKTHDIEDLVQQAAKLDADFRTVRQSSRRLDTLLLGLPVPGRLGRAHALT